MLIDSHAHLDLPEFDPDREAVIDRARKQGLIAVISIGINLKSSRAALDIARRHPDVFSTVGFHPNDSHQVKAGDLSRIAELARDPRVVAIGEIGLDFYRRYSPHETQVEVFQQQLSLASELRLPVVIHSRNASRETWDILSRWAQSAPVPQGGKRGVIHCFSGDAELARRYIGLGFMISFVGSVTYPSAVDRVRVAREVPLESMLVETDAPFLAQQLHRGDRNEPAYVSLVAGKIAQVKGVPVDEVARVTTRNAIALFHLPLGKEALCQSPESTS